jgi:hypothetical protein
MGQEIVYCVSCQTQLRSADFEKGQALKFGTESVCKKCAPEAVKSLPPHKAQTLQKAMETASLEKPLPLPASTPRSGTSRIPHATPPTRRVIAAGKSSGAILGLGVGAAALLVVAFFSLSSVKPSSAVLQGPLSPTISPSPSDPVARGPRAEGARESFRKALAFADTHPHDLTDQIRLLEQALDVAKGTDIEAETKHALEVVKRRAKEIVAKELLVLDQKVRASCVREEFKSALLLIEDARKKALPLEWNGEMDVRATEVQSRADTAFVLVKDQALRAKPEELKALKERVAKWGLERFDLEDALVKATLKEEPPVPPKPPESTPAEPAAKPAPAPSPPPAPPRRPAVPEGAKQREVEATIRKTFSLDQAKTTKEKADLGRTLLQTTASSGAMDAELYVLLRLARDLAGQASDSKTALGCIDAMAVAFDIDLFGEKAALLTKTQVRGADAAPWARTCLEVADQALEAEEYDAAFRLAERAEALARGANERVLADIAKQRSKDSVELKREAERAKPSLKLLETKPDDAEANAAVGRFLCLFKEAWDRGLPMLARGSDAALKKLAELELSKPSDSAAQASLGEAWATQAERELGNAKPRLRARASMWLERAIPGLTGPARVSAEKKLASLGPAATGRDRLRGITFQSAEQLKLFVTSGGNWRIENNELIGSCSGDIQWATYRTAFSAISQVTLRARIVPPAQHNLRLWVGPIHIIFNWEGADRDCYRNGKAFMDKPISALKPGKEYEISMKQQGSKVVVAIDGITQWETEATLNGTVSLQAAHDSTIGIRQLTIEGIPDSSKKVIAENRQVP